MAETGVFFVCMLIFKTRIYHTEIWKTTSYFIFQVMLQGYFEIRKYNDTMQTQFDAVICILVTTSVRKLQRIIHILIYTSLEVMAVVEICFKHKLKSQSIDPLIQILYKHYINCIQGSKMSSFF